jgi:hypothetical protein
MRVTIKPPDRSLYDQRCKAARECFLHSDIMPPFLVTYICYSVMYRALGGNLRIIRYVLGQLVSDLWGDCRDRLWWTWHLYIRCRSRGEIQELIDQRLKELTGEDEREWPEVVIADKEGLRQ